MEAGFLSSCEIASVNQIIIFSTNKKSLKGFFHILLNIQFKMILWNSFRPEPTSKLFLLKSNVHLRIKQLKLKVTSPHLHNLNPYKIVFSKALHVKFEKQSCPKPLIIFNSHIAIHIAQEHKRLAFISL